ncbi:hypothetical protein CK203_041667 [Vitis vinifera]|uniref:Endonuclease/exonuclease/phosphatase domain-containing protein n=1 Tax=Vitis vinifera TaxID=29760 RepID=A0A438HCV2_VITVI|nr:hypothetical protein CK203_041667 [Vitis vinifera]
MGREWLGEVQPVPGLPYEGAGEGNIEFLTKIRKRREKIHSKELLEKSKFERELKRLKCSINYEGGMNRKARLREIPRLESCECGGSFGRNFYMLDRRSLDILDWEEGQFTLSCRFRNVENGVIWVFTGVYGPFSKVERDALWEEFGAIRGLWEDPWCIGGDFNITLFPRERSSQRRINSAMRKFAETVNDLGLVDLPLQGGDFTWNGGQHNQIWARLDRFLVSPSWIDQFSGINQ